MFPDQISTDYPISPIPDDVYGRGAPIPAPRTPDLVVTALLWFLLATLAIVSVAISPWFLLATGVCEGRADCSTDPSTGNWIIVLGGCLGFLFGAATTVNAARSGRALYPGALVGVVLVLAAWLAGSFLMG
ncbi:hypothetical protein [Nocardia sp. NBC_00416]|uniref:hypothetical protein n=1 Tax=Nocardia sp. NBC_00416 TaxID=2975991 RepID=UPI002E1E438D